MKAFNFAVKGRAVKWHDDPGDNRLRREATQGVKCLLLLFLPLATARRRAGRCLRTTGLGTNTAVSLVLS